MITRLIRNPLAAALTLSALMHALTWWLIRTAPREVIRDPELITVTIAQPAAVPAPGVRAGRSRANRTSRARSTGSLSNLMPKLNAAPKQDWTKEVDYSASTDWTDARNFDSAAPSINGIGTKTQIVFVESLWRMIDQYVEENPFLSEYGHVGDVFLRFEISARDELVPESFTARAPDRVLKVLAARAIRRAIQNETGDVHFPHERMAFTARFTWRSYDICPSRRGFVGTHLTFCHYAENKRKTFSAAERTETWARAIYKHGPWAAQEIRKYNREHSRRKSQFNPFAKFELDPDWNL